MEIFFPDGSHKRIGSDGAEDIHFPDGTRVQVHKIFCEKLESNQRSFKIESFRFPAFVPKKIEYIRF
jgi:hypothetical protein